MIDTHCHLHDSSFYPDKTVQEDFYQQAIADDVTMVCVGTDIASSRQAIEFSNSHQDCFAVVGIHPHDAASNDVGEIAKLLDRHQNIVAIGEIGLDYFYLNSPRHAQILQLEAQLQLAVDYNLPVSFHVREANNTSDLSVWEDFWPIVENFSSLKGGVLHSFTDTREQCEEGLSRGFYIGVNGISTFTKDQQQNSFFDWLPLENTVLETDAPFLTPAPFRGTMNRPSYVGRVAESTAIRKNVSLSLVSDRTTANAKQLFAI